MNPVTEVKANALQGLTEYGQSVWLDYIRRSLITSGELKRLLEEDGLRGITSNPSIFEKAIAGSTEYDNDIRSADAALDAKAVYEKLAVSDIQAAAHVLKPTYVETQRRDGYISIEVSPLLASDSEGTLKEAKRLWSEIGRENILIKVPGTPEGIVAIRKLIACGINVNVTLLFAQDVYEQVAEAYISGLEDFAAAGGDVSRVASVASFFISRIDTAVDAILTDKLHAATDKKDKDLITNLLGKTAIANGKLTYQRYLEIYGTPRWHALEAKGAQTQRLLWASTSTKNPAYRDTLYVDELIGKDTVNTIPPATFNAFREHGRLRASLTEEPDKAREILQDIEKLGVSLKEVTARLLTEGLELFSDAFVKLLDAVEKQRKSGCAAAIDCLTYKLPDELDAAVKKTLEQWQTEGRVKRLWARDSSLWTGEDESKWLDWLSVTEDQSAHVERFKKLAQDVKQRGFTHALLLGMGGSSLCPEVMRMTFGKLPGFPELHILDSTDPAQIRSREKQIDLAKTVFIVSSKSGSTLEPNIFKQYFFERASQVLGKDKAGDRFIAVTDPGSKLEKDAEADGFWEIFYGVPGIGGRYSALSNFGMVPSAVIGVDVGKFLDNAHEMVEDCAATVPVKENPGVVLGAIMGVLAKSGRDKVTLVASPGIWDLGAWLEQLLAESTGKQGRGIIPIDREQLGPPEVYGKDRLFAYLRLEGGADPAQDAAIDALEKAGHPVVRIRVTDIYNLGQEFFRWEIATAVAGSIIGINAFNQPDVEASKVVTRELTTEYEKTGKLPPEAPIFEEDGIKLFTDDRNAAELSKIVGKDKTLARYLRAHIDRLHPGDYFALLGYLEMNDEHQIELQVMRHCVRDMKKVATCLGFGPRFLHSTGQAYKGGPNTGVFLQLTCDDAEDLPVPGQKYTFGIVKAAQARGDFQVLSERGRRALRVHLPSDTKAGLAKLRAALLEALA